MEHESDGDTESKRRARYSLQELVQGIKELEIRCVRTIQTR